MKPSRATLLAMLACIACASPEAARTRGSGAGGDVGNRDRVIEMHAGAEPYYGTPCAMRPKECSEPKPVFDEKRD